MISFIMPAKNSSKYIYDAINPLLNSSRNLELIIIDDHSNDDTFEIIKKISDNDKRIKVFENKSRGKVAGLNYGYSLSRGDIIKCIDSDDVIDTKLIEILAQQTAPVMCHNAIIVGRSLNPLGTYNINKTILSSNFMQCLQFLISLPRWTWSFNRDIGDKIFPLPEELPFEDVWFSLIIKRYSNEIEYNKKRLYMYRQHDQQTYGGMLNFSNEILIFRAKRELKLLDVLESHLDRFSVSSGDIFQDIRYYNQLLCKEEISIKKILFSNLPLALKLRLILFKKMNYLSLPLAKIKWFLNGLR